MQNQNIRHLSVLSVNLGLLLRRAYLAHVLWILIQVRLIAQTLGYPVDAGPLVLLLHHGVIVSVDRYRPVVERLGTLSPCLALQTLRHGDRRAAEELVHLADIAQASRRRILSEQLGRTWRRHQTAQLSRLVRLFGQWQAGPGWTARFLFGLFRRCIDGHCCWCHLVEWCCWCSRFGSCG